ncbi:FkbM family methyltransferase [Pedobacter sp. W3I1]|nr:FkbM family methyltransferase [Pedobacter sp. W3I1]MDQ0640900.1 FkbM family methyltransferase [Pedobacter sp. W3I1]
MGKYRLENVIPFIKNIKTLIRFKVRKGEHFSNYCKQNLEISFFELARLMNSNKPRMNAMIFKKEITIIDSFWYIHSLREIFYLNTYKFSSTNEEPYIIDCGSNIGLSIIYFKKLFPNSKVLGFEPDPKIYEILKHNLKIFSYTDIILENKAVWNEIATLPFSSTGSIGGNIGRLNEDNVDNIINVETIRLKRFFDTKNRLFKN